MKNSLREANWDENTTWSWIDVMYYTECLPHLLRDSLHESDLDVRDEGNILAL